MINKATIVFLIAISTLIVNSASALPTFVGKYGGFTRDKTTGLLATYTNRSILKDIQIAALNAACITNIPGQEQSTSERDTTITKAETPIIRVRSNGRFSATFDLIDESRVDFKDASVTLEGRLRGGKGKVDVTIAFAKTYEDGSSETCSGTAAITLKRGSR